MSDNKVITLADRLHEQRVECRRAGYLVTTWDEWFIIARDWVETHKDWSLDDLFLGIKYYNYCFPEHVNMDMIEVAKTWEKQQKKLLKKFDK